MKWLAIGMFAALAISAPAIGQPIEPNCPADAVALPAELSGWTAKQDLAAAADTAELGAATLPVGKAANLTLRPTPSIHYALRPENPGGTVSSGGMVGFSVDRAGTYRVALGAAPWIDVVRDGKSAISVAHGRGPACSGIRKMVDFSLQPGKYVLQISGSGTAAIAVLVARLP